MDVSALRLQRKTFFEEMQHVTGMANDNHVIDIMITESLIMRDIEANIIKLPIDVLTERLDAVVGLVKPEPIA